MHIEGEAHGLLLNNSRHFKVVTLHLPETRHLTFSSILLSCGVAAQAPRVPITKL